VPHTMLVGRPEDSWREWLENNASDSDWLILDPANADFGAPCRLIHLSKGTVKGWSFVGCLDPRRDPISFLAAAGKLLANFPKDGVVIIFGFRSNPLVRHLALNCAQMADPSRIVVPDGSGIEAEPWPVGAEVATLPMPLPSLARSAQRRARWLELREQCEPHNIDLSSVKLMGCRFGSGRHLGQNQRAAIGLDWAKHAEVAGSTLTVVADGLPSDDAIARALAATGTTQYALVEPSAFPGLVCSFAHDDGADFGMGFIEQVDFENRRMSVLCRAVAPAPVRVLRVGALVVDPTGKELGETKAWAV